MVIGNGIKAKRFMNYMNNDTVLIFADTVSNSKENYHELFDLEEIKIKKAIQENPHKLFIYFSSTSLYDVNEKKSLYVKHILKMEDIVKNYCSSYLIFRLSQIVGNSNNENTIINNLVHTVLKEEKAKILKNTYQSILDIDHVYLIVNKIIQDRIYENRIVNIANPENILVDDLVKIIQVFFDKKVDKKYNKKESNYQIDITDIIGIIEELGIVFNDDYICNILKKYYSYLKNRQGLISVVVPTYFQEKGISEFYKRTKKVLLSLHPRFSHEIIFINDGSTDGTLNKLVEISNNDPMVKIINFSRNFGNQIAITAGIHRAKGDAVIIIDDDLQDPPEVILDMITKWEEGFEVVFGIRKRRRGTNLFFRIIAKLYYRFLDYISDIRMPVDTGDFRLIDKKVVKNLLLFNEGDRYFRGMVPWVGFNQIGLSYERDARFTGQTTFTLTKYIKFAFDGITGFSEKPLYYSSFIGFIITTVGFFFMISLIILKINNPEISIRGWSSLVSIILFFGGIQLISIGIVGLYIGKIYNEVKKRPLYIVENEYGFVDIENE